MSDNKGLAFTRYTQLEKYREPYLKRAREAAALTIPHLMPPLGHTSTSDLPTPYQSVGARGLRNLASKLLLTLFPPHTPFYKYSVDDFVVKEIEQEGGAEGRGQIEEALSARERAVMKEVEAAYFRTAAFEGLRQLLLGGNVMIYVPPNDGLAQVFRLDSYVVSRDPEGTLLEFCLKQHFAPLSLPEEVRALLGSSSPTNSTSANGDEATVALFTYGRRTRKGKYEVFQEVEGKIIPNTRQVYDEKYLPYMCLRLTKIDGEDYGRGYVEEFLGDLVSLEGLSQSLLEATAVVSKVVTLVNPNGITNPKDISEAENGDVVGGNPDDVHLLQAEKRADLSVAREQVQELTQRLAFGFLMNTAIQRDGERVTAEEIRYMAQELEDGLGGMYSMLAHEFQMPTVYLFEKRMERKRGVPPLPKDITTPAVVTGIDALGRGQDLRNLDAFLIGLGQNFGPEVLGRYVKLGEVIKRRGAALGIDMSNLIYSDQEIAANDQQAKIEALAQNLGPDAIKALAATQGKQIDGANKLALEDAKKKGN